MLRETSAACVNLVGKMVLPMAASWQTGSLIGCRSCAAPAAAGVQVASSGAVLSSLSASPSTPVDSRAADGASVRHESSPVKRLPCNTRRGRRHGSFRRSTYRTGFHVQNDFGEIVEKVHSTYFRKMYTIWTEAGAQLVQLFRHRGGDSTQAGESVSHPKLPQILITYQRSFHQFSKVKCGLKDLSRIPFLSNVCGVKFVQATSKEDIPGEGGHDDRKVFLGKCEKRLQILNELANTSVGVKGDITQEVELPPPHGKEEQETRPHA